MRARLVGRLHDAGRSLDIDPKAELAEARRLVEKHKYGGRKDELEDAEMAILHPDQFPAYLKSIYREEEEKRIQKEKKTAEEKAKRGALEKQRIRVSNRREKQSEKTTKQKKKDANRNKKRKR